LPECCRTCGLKVADVTTTGDDDRDVARRVGLSPRRAAGFHSAKTVENAFIEAFSAGAASMMSGSTKIASPSLSASVVDDASDE